jgi:DNA repair photolyase
VAAVTLPIVDTAVAGCTYIYAPKGRAGEYAPLAANPYRGCGHACAYCYVPIVLKMKRPVFDAGAIPRPDFIKHLTKDAKKYQAAGITEQVMLSFTSDPYHPGDSSLTRETLMVLRDHGLGIATLSKGGTRALRDVDLFRPDRDAFASTLTRACSH